MIALDAANDDALGPPRERHVPPPTPVERSSESPGEGDGRPEGLPKFADADALRGPKIYGPPGNVSSPVE